MQTGLVIRNTGSWYTVRTDDGDQLIDCKIKGNFRLKGIRSTNPVAVGDRVTVVPNQEGTAFITAIEDRRNYIIRKASNLSKQSHIIAANVDQAILVVTVNYPQTSTTFIDRFLASAEAYRVPVILVFNKVDMLDDDELRYLDMMVNLYETVGYECYRISAQEGDGVDALRPLCSVVIAELESQHLSIAFCQTPILERQRFLMLITRVCTPLRSVRCLPCPPVDISLTLQVSRASARSISSGRN